MHSNSSSQYVTTSDVYGRALPSSLHHQHHIWHFLLQYYCKNLVSKIVQTMTCYRQTCTQIITGRSLKYRRALKVIQNEEYLMVTDLEIIRRLYEGVGFKSNSILFCFFFSWHDPRSYFLDSRFPNVNNRIWFEFILSKVLLENILRNWKWDGGRNDKQVVVADIRHHYFPSLSLTIPTAKLQLEETIIIY